MKAKVYHQVYKSLKLDFVLNQLNPVHALYIYYILHTILYIYYIYLHILIIMLLDRQHGHKTF